MRNYGVVFSSFWASPTIQNLSDDGKLLALYLLSCPHTTIIGLFRAPDGYVSEDLAWGSERVTKGFQELHANGFATRDSSTKWVVIHKFLQWNQIENPNQAKAAIKVFMDAPDKLPFKADVALVLVRSCERFRDKIQREFETLRLTLQKPFRNQEQEQEQEQEQVIHPSQEGVITQKLVIYSGRGAAC